MSKVACPKCHKVFDSEFEYRILHWPHNHPGPVPAPLVQTEPVGLAAEVAPAIISQGFESRPEHQTEEPKADEEAPYSLATSGEGLGELYPVLKDAHGNVIDGFHRLGENPNWHAEVRPQIDTPVKLQLAMLAANFNRRNMAPEEITQRITFLVKAGLKPEEIAKTTGISERTIRKYTPQEFKDPVKVEVGRLGGESSAARVHQTVKIPDTAPTPRPDSRIQGLETVQPKPEPIPEGTPICPVCQGSMDPVEYEEVKQAVAVKYGKQIQTLLFPPPMKKT